MKKKILGALIALVGLMGIQNISAATTFKVGDYVKMTPSKTSYTISKDITGLSREQNINPSELNLWRVIKVNSDGTVDLISQNTSSTPLTFYGKSGWQHYIGTLKEVAKQYENSEFTNGSRYIGYDSNQQDYINYLPSNGEGGTMPDEDFRVLDSLDIKKADKNYWAALRLFQSPTTGEKYYSGQVMHTTGSYAPEVMYEKNSNMEKEGSSFIRPIVILKSGLTATGAGTENDPYVLGDNNSNTDNSGNGNNNENQTTPGNNNGSDQSNNNNQNGTSSSTKKEDIEKNPPTGKFLPIAVISVGVILSGIVYFIARKKNKVYKI